MISKLIKFLLGGCDHVWKVYADISLRNSDGKIYKPMFILQCIHCGNMKKKDLGDFLGEQYDK